MEGDGSFIAALTEAVEERNKHIEHTVLPKLKEQFRMFHASLQSLMTVLIRKGLIQEDPYKTDHKTSDSMVTEDTEFGESERAVVVGIRMSELDNVLEYTNNYCEFSVTSLDFAEIKRLTDITRYVEWDNLSTNSLRPTTRSLANLMGRLRAGTDSLAAGILASALGNLGDGCRGITEQLKVLKAFQRERYKLELRTMVFPRVSADDPLVADDPKSLRKVRSAFSQSGMNGPFVPELASEVIAEESGPDADQKKSETLNGLRTKVDKPKKKNTQVPLRQILTDAIRSLAAASRALDAVLERLRDNAAIIQNRKQGLGVRFGQWVRKLIGNEPARKVYELEFMDEATGTRHRETIDLDNFLEMLHKKARIYGGILAKSGSLWTKIEGASEDQLYQFVNKELGDVHLIHRRSNAFYGYFKAHTDKDEKRKLRGIKIELTQ